MAEDKQRLMQGHRSLENMFFIGTIGNVVAFDCSGGSNPVKVWQSSLKGTGYFPVTCAWCVRQIGEITISSVELFLEFLLTFFLVVLEIFCMRARGERLLLLMQ